MPTARTHHWLPVFVLALALLPVRTTTLAADPPPADEVTAKLAEVEAEVALLRKLTPAESPAAARYADELDREVRRLRADWEAGDAQAPAAGAEVGKNADEAAAPELYVVGFYEGSMPNGPKRFGTAVVDVQVTDRPVVLALCAYEPIRWELRVAPGVRLQRLIVGGYGDQILEPAPPAGVLVEKHVYKAGGNNYFYTFPNADSDSEVPAAEKLRTLTGLPVSTLQGAYRYPDRPIVVGPRDTEWRRQRVMTHLDPLWREATALRRAERRLAVSGTRFHAIRWTGGLPMRGGAELGEASPAGWIEGTLRRLPGRANRVALDPRGPTWFAIGDRTETAMRLDLEAGTATNLEIKEDIPEFSWPCGIAFDSKRNRLLVATMFGRGYLYACDTAANTWSLLRNMKDLDLHHLEALAYSAEEDCLYGIGMDRGRRGALAIHQLTPDGEPIRSFPVKADVKIDPMASHMTPAQVVPVGKQIVLLLPPPDRSMRRPPRPGQANQAPPPPMKCLVVDPATGEVTYSGEMASVPAVAAAAPAAAEGPELRALWTAVQQAPPAEADKAVQAFTAGGDAAVAVVRISLAPPVPHDGAALRAALSRLESDDWKQREAAAAELIAAGGTVEPALRKALDATKSEEARQRLEAVLKQVQILRDGPATPEAIDTALGDSALRTRLRAVRTLARIGTPAAVRLLRDIAGGPTDSIDVVHARRALARL
ncbi:MAG TPA: HEAT repeat domain-containing protein [Tepidisphaeraceae bacterium]|nr:HEAT repeat domain-containing protein [Tepidisphaeraceae bacterium]